eukprot:5709250-Pleurochrysis_carterae.AAC.2
MHRAKAISARACNSAAKNAARIHPDQPFRVTNGSVLSSASYHGLQRAVGESGFSGVLDCSPDADLGSTNAPSLQVGAST